MVGPSETSLHEFILENTLSDAEFAELGDLIADGDQSPHFTKSGTGGRLYDHYPNPKYHRLRELEQQIIDRLRPYFLDGSQYVVEGCCNGAAEYREIDRRFWSRAQYIFRSRWLVAGGARWTNVYVRPARTSKIWQWAKFAADVAQRYHPSEHRQHDLFDEIRRQKGVSIPKAQWTNVLRQAGLDEWLRPGRKKGSTKGQSDI